MVIFFNCFYIKKRKGNNVKKPRNNLPDVKVNGPI